MHYINILPEIYPEPRGTILGLARFPPSSGVEGVESSDEQRLCYADYFTMVFHVTGAHSVQRCHHETICWDPNTYC